MTRHPSMPPSAPIPAARESQTVEFKRVWRDEFLKELCGFANAQGGTLVLGLVCLLFLLSFPRRQKFPPAPLLLPLPH